MDKPRSRLFLAGTVIALMVMTPTTGMSAPGGIPAAAPVTDELQISTNTGDEVTGSFARGASIVEFESHRTSAVSASVSILVNGKKVTASRDLKAGTATWSGAGAVMLPDDREVLLGLTTALNLEWLEPTRDQKGTLGGHRDMVLRMVMLLAEAPLGMPLDAQVTPRPVERTLERTPEMIGVEPADLPCVSDVIATTDAGSDERREAVIQCQAADDNGIWYMTCDTGYRAICHDATTHCWGCEWVHSGPASFECMGECGPGCWGLNIYSVDCGDHDQCGRVHGGSYDPWDANCGDEYSEASDDFIWGWPNCF